MFCWCSFGVLGDKTNHINEWKRHTIPSIVGWCLEYNRSPESIYEHQHENDGIFFMPAAADCLQKNNAQDQIYLHQNMEWIISSSRRGIKWVSDQQRKWAIDLSYATVGLVVPLASDNDETTDEMAPRGVNRASVKTGCLQTRYHILSSSPANTGRRTWQTGTHMNSLMPLNWQD